MSGPNFTFTPDVPQASQKISATQNPILSNFEAINELINQNHIGFADPNDFGKHAYTSLPLQGSDPTTLSDEMALYAKSTPGGVNPAEIFYRYPNNGAIEQLTSAGGGSANTTGWCYLPTGIIMKWGQATGIVSGANTIIFPTGGSIPAFASSVYTITYSPLAIYTNSYPMPYISSQSITQFVLTVPNTGSNTIQWMAIGV